MRAVFADPLAARTTIRASAPPQPIEGNLIYARELWELWPLGCQPELMISIIQTRPFTCLLVAKRSRNSSLASYGFNHLSLLLLMASVVSDVELQARVLSVPAYRAASCMGARPHHSIQTQLHVHLYVHAYRYLHVC